MKKESVKSLDAKVQVESKLKISFFDDFE